MCVCVCVCVCYVNIHVETSCCLIVIHLLEAVVAVIDILGEGALSCTNKQRAMRSNFSVNHWEQKRSHLGI